MFKYFVKNKFHTKIYNFAACNCALKIKYDIVKKYKANNAKKKLQLLYQTIVILFY